MPVVINGLYVGDGHQFSAGSTHGVASGIDGKAAVAELNVQLDHLEGDARFDQKNHGGAERVLHHFPAEHYSFFKQQGLLSNERAAPALGENISTLGMLEQDVCIGDEITIGAVRLQISLPRAPCFKTNLQFHQREFARTMQNTARCGWLYRVLTPGKITAADTVTLAKRHGDISVADAIRLYFAEGFDAKAYQRLLTAPYLGQDWQRNLQRRLATGTVENWQGRLYGSDAFYQGWS